MHHLNIKRLYRFLLTGKYKPYIFEETVPKLPSSFGDIGLYLHIPFCKQICPFCPYNKTLIHEQDVDEYENSVRKEVGMYRERLDKSNIPSLYVGGGTPTSAMKNLDSLISFLRKSFKIEPEIGVEVHPNDASIENLSALKRNGVNLLSLGVQSFQDKLLQRIFRPYNGKKAKEALDNVIRVGFDSVDIDLMFGLPGETENELKHDLVYAFKSDIGQLSTYPLIVFPFTYMPEIFRRNNYKKPIFWQERRLLQLIQTVSETYGYERTSIWTWTKRDKKQYTSVTRENFLGLGAGASTRFNHLFYANTFSVVDYIKSTNKGILPIALSIHLDKKDEMSWWLFWAAYKMSIRKKEFKQLFGQELDQVFGVHLKTLKYLGLLEESDDVYRLTERGGFIFHLIEQGYSLDFLNKMWGTLSFEAWPKKLSLG